LHLVGYILEYTYDARTPKATRPVAGLLYFMMHGPMNVKSPNNISKWQMGFNSVFKGLNCLTGGEQIRLKFVREIL
jgi:hypothetical protein